jgi:hypothetical protein
MIVRLWRYIRALRAAKAASLAEVEAARQAMLGALPAEERERLLTEEGQIGTKIERAQRTKPRG